MNKQDGSTVGGRSIVCLGLGENTRIRDEFSGGGGGGRSIVLLLRETIPIYNITQHRHES